MMSCILILLQANDLKENAPGVHKFLKVVHEGAMKGSITRASARKIVSAFYEGVGPELRVKVPKNKHQLDVLMIASRDDDVPTCGEPARLRACEHTIFHASMLIHVHATIANSWQRKEKSSS